jgi:glucose/mannose transport system substrate-binding protein
MTYDPGTLASSPAAARSRPNATVDLVHWWASRGETAAFDVLRGALLHKGITCDDTPVSGGAAMLAHLEARLAVGQCPMATVQSGFGARQWGDRGILGDLTAPAKAGDWDKVVPAALHHFCRYNGRWIGVPSAIHSVNWLWINRKAADRIGLTHPPASLEELFDALDRAQAAGLVPLAIGRQAWLVATILDSLVVAANGYGFYRSAFADLDTGALNSSGMVDAFRALARLGGYVHTAPALRDWTDATRLVANGEALLEVSGDWVRAELQARQARPAADYDCVRFPGTEDGVIFNADIIVMLDVEPHRRAAQCALALTVMDPAVQAAFCNAKGAAPARMDMPDAGLDRFVRSAMADIRNADASGTFIGSMAHGYMQPAPLQEAYLDVAMQAFEGRLAPRDAAAELAARFQNLAAAGPRLTSNSKDFSHADL